MRGQKDVDSRHRSNRKRNLFRRFCRFLFRRKKGNQPARQEAGGVGSKSPRTTAGVSPTPKHMSQHVSDNGSVRPVGNVSCGAGCSMAEGQRKSGEECPSSLGGDSENEDVTGKIVLVSKDMPNQRAEIAELRRSAQRRKRLNTGLQNEVARLNHRT